MPRLDDAPRPARRAAGLRLPFPSPHGACRIYDAAGVQIATVDIATRERRDMAGRLERVMATAAAQPEREGIDVVFAGRVTATHSNVADEIAARRMAVRERARQFAEEDAA